jgi:hypothetical protein
LTEAVKPPVTVVFDGSRIPNCKKIVCEIRTAVDADSMELRVLKNIVFDTAAGEIAFSADQIQSDAYYIRFRGQASDGRLVGWWSDQICLKL